MRIGNLRNYVVSKLLTFGLGLSIVLFASPQCFAKGGVIDSGGGDDLVRDFMAVARQEVYPWLIENEHSKNPIGVSAEQFLQTLNTAALVGAIKSALGTYKSCIFSSQYPVRQSEHDDEVAACYDGTNIYLSEKYWILQNIEDMSVDTKRALITAKMGTVAHEIFRMMNIGEGDNYKFSSLMPTADFDLNETSKRTLCKIAKDQLIEAEIAHPHCSVVVYVGIYDGVPSALNSLILDSETLDRFCRGVPSILSDLQHVELINAFERFGKNGMYSGCWGVEVKP